PKRRRRERARRSDRAAQPLDPRAQQVAPRTPFLRLHALGFDDVRRSALEEARISEARLERRELLLESGELGAEPRALLRDVDQPLEGHDQLRAAGDDPA